MNVVQMLTRVAGVLNNLNMNLTVHSKVLEM